MGEIQIIETKTQHLSDILCIASHSGLSCWSCEDYKKFLFSPQSVCLSAIVKDKIKGFLTARLIIQEDYSELYDIAVNYTDRSKNVGSTLLEKLILITKENNIKRILLEVRATNLNAVNFYKKHGFTIIAERKNFYSNPQESGWTMEKIL